MSSADIQTQIDRMTRELSDIKHKLSIEMSTLQKESDKVQENIRFLNAEIERLQPFAEEKQSEIDSYDQAIARSESEWSSQQQSIERRISDHEKRVAQLESDIHKANDDLESAKKKELAVKAALLHAAADPQLDR